MTLDEAFVQVKPTLQHYALRRFSVTDQTASAEDLVHDAYVKAKTSRSMQRTELNDAGHAVRLLTRMMRQIVIDKARQVKGLNPNAEFDIAFVSTDPVPWQTTLVHDALERLHKVDPSAGKVVDLKFFLGLKDEEVAAVMGINFAKVRRDWEFARSFIRSFVSQ